MVLENADLWCEPGRALAAESGSLLTQVELVKPGAVYLNDGAYGALFDAAHENWRYPVRSLRDGEALDGPTKAMRVYGPTCDSADRLAKKVLLPAILEEGDFLEFGNLGAYGEAMATQFNGFGRYSAAIVEDSPFASLYRPSADILEFPAARLSGAAL